MEYRQTRSRCKMCTERYDKEKNKKKRCKTGNKTRVKISKLFNTLVSAVSLSAFAR